MAAMLTEILPSKATVATRLEASLTALLTAEQAVLETTLELVDARQQLQEAEDRALLADPPLIDGKNAEIRAAQLRDVAPDRLGKVQFLEDKHLRVKTTLEGARATLSTYKALARLLAGSPE